MIEVSDKTMLIQIIKIAVKNAFKEHLAEIEPKPMLNTEYITMKELCSILKVSKVTIHTWKKAGVIPFEKVCGKLLFDKQVILNRIKDEPAVFGKVRNYPEREF